MDNINNINTVNDLLLLNVSNNLKEARSERAECAPDTNEQRIDDITDIILEEHPKVGVEVILNILGALSKLHNEHVNDMETVDKDEVAAWIYDKARIDGAFALIKEIEI